MAQKRVEEQLLRLKQVDVVLSAAEPPPEANEVVVAAPGATKRFSRNAAMSVGRLLLTSMVALLVPGYLTHKLPVQTFSAWVLILQMSAYVSYLDFGVQTAIAKYVAEYEERGDSAGAGMRASAGLAILVGTSLAGVLLTILLAWQVPHLFHAMPSSLFHDVRVSLLLTGVSLSFGLVCSVTSSIFMGLQRYGVPTLIMLINRILFTAAVMVTVGLHCSLATMAAGVAVVNVATGLAQVVAWRRLASHIRLSLRGLDMAVVRKMLSYCAVLAIWTMGMLCVSGLDVTIVGRYDFGQTAAYSIAVLPTNFLISIMGAALGPLLPAASARNAASSPAAMGDLLARATRYSTLLLALTGLPLLLAGYWALRIWVGPAYAVQTVGYLRVLILANLIRNLCLPYAMMLVATDRQKTAIAGATAEAIVNLGFSIYLAQRMGAMGVAIATVLGAVVSIAMHFAVSLRYTRGTFAISRVRLFLTSIVRPAAMGLPSLVCVGLWWRNEAPRLTPAGWLLWAASTLLIGWFFGLQREERTRLLGWIRERIRPSERIHSTL